MEQKKHVPARPVPLLYVAEPSASATETTALLETKGMAVTRADNVCYAEMQADAQHFEAAIYDRSINQQEQASLARTMRIRWPWMRILRWVGDGAPLLEEELFDWSVRTQPELAACVQRRLARRTRRGMLDSL